MSVRVRAATDRDLSRLWPAVAADHLFADEAAFRRYAAEQPWHVRVSDRGDAALLGRWRNSLDVLAMRAVWTAERAVPDLAADAKAVALANGFGRVLSPLLPEVLLGGYRAAGMHEALRIVAIQGRPQLVVPAGPPLGVVIREGHLADLPSVAMVDAASFERFWRYDVTDLAGLLDLERLAVAETEEGGVIGYTLTTVSRGAATLSRLATAPRARRAGVGRALLAESAAWSARQGAETFALCTQEENSASRALYASAGLAEVRERYAFALGEA